MNRKILVTVVLFLVVALSKGQTFEDLTCNYICPDNYEPVCGFNGEEYEEFATECELKNANCLLGRDKAKGNLLTSYLSFQQHILIFSFQDCKDCSL